MINILKIFLCITIHQTIGVFSLAADSGEATHRIVRDILYNQEDTINCRLDLYIPEAVNDYMTLIWFHGGSLKEGSRTRIDATAIGNGFGSEGIAAVIVDYRMYPDARFPDFLEDAAASVNWYWSILRIMAGIRTGYLWEDIQPEDISPPCWPWTVVI